MKKGRKISYVLLALSTLIALTSCDTTSLQEDLKTIGAKLIPNVWAFLVQLLALVCLLVFVILFAYKPIHKFIDKRKEFLQNQVDETDRLNKEAKEFNEESAKGIKEANMKANEIIKKAEMDANLRRDAIIEEAQKESDEIREKSLKEIEAAKEKAFKELSREIVDVAIDASEKVLEREVNSEDNRNVVDNFVKGLKEEN